MTSVVGVNTLAFLQSAGCEVCGPSVCYLGAPQQRMGGWLNGEFVAALPDMVSDLMLMSRAYARERGFYINDDPGYQVLFEYGDRSRAYTTGLVEGVEWVFGDLDGNDFGRTQNCSFLVVDDLTCDVIFSDDFLVHTNALEEMAHCELVFRMSGCL